MNPKDAPFFEYRAAAALAREELAVLGATVADDDGKQLTLTEALKTVPPGTMTPAVRKANALRNALVTKNTGLVHTVANRYRNKALDHDDLAQAGFLGLIRAIEDYNPERAAFSTYAVFWIRHYVQNALQQTGLLQTRETVAAGNAAGRFYALHGRLPTASDLNLEPGAVLDHEQVRRVFVSTNAEVKGDRGFGAQGTLTLEETLSDGAPTQFQQMERGERDEAIREAIDALPPSEREVILATFFEGGDDEDEITMSDVAARAKLAKQTIRQRKLRALDRLKRTIGNHEKGR